MDKATKLTLKTCINNFENNLANTNNDIKTLEFLASQQKEYIKKCQDGGMLEEAIDNQMDVLFQINEAIDKINYASDFLSETVSRLKFIKKGKV